MKLLLDTGTFLWIVGDAAELSDTARAEFRDPGNEVYLSAVSAWEIAVKHALGKLPSPRPPSALIPELRRRHAIAELPLEEEATLYVSRLPSVHRDPFDRMLICQAIVHGLTILTSDEAVHRYPVRTLW